MTTLLEFLGSTAGIAFITGVLSLVIGAISGQHPQIAAFLSWVRDFLLSRKSPPAAMFALIGLLALSATASAQQPCCQGRERGPVRQMFHALRPGILIPKTGQQPCQAQSHAVPLSVPSLASGSGNSSGGSIGSSGSSCPGGVCPAPTTQRRRLFP